MSSEANMDSNQVVQAKAKESWIKDRIKDHGELIAALLSGFLILRRLAIEQDRNKYSFHHPIHLGVLYRRVCKS